MKGWQVWRIPLGFGMLIFHECQRSTACCRWPGEVRLTDAEITRLAAFKGLSEFDFIQRFTGLSGTRQCLTLIDQPSGACVFLEGDDCSVQPVKPQQCRDLPNLWNFPGFEKACRAVPQLVSADEYARLVERATGRAAAHQLNQVCPPIHYENHHR